MTAKNIVTDMMRSSDVGDFERFRALLDPACEWVNPVVQATGADAIAENVAAFMAPFRDRLHDIALMLESGGTVAVEGTWTATTEDGRAVRTPFAAIIRVRGDRVAAVHLYADTAPLTAQLGAAA